MSADSFQAKDDGAASEFSEALVKVFYAKRNGKLYRSADGINWEIEEDESIASIPEGTSRIALRKKIEKEHCSEFGCSDKGAASITPDVSEGQHPGKSIFLRIKD